MDGLTFMGAIIIDVPPLPEPTVYSKVQMATELSFAELIKRAKESGLPVQPVMGLMYLPEQAATREFQQGCRAVLKCLGVPTTL